MNLKLILILVSTALCGNSNEDNYLGYCTSKNAIDYLVNIITAQLKKGLTYQNPQNASKYSAEGCVIDYGSFDFIVVGAGSAGTVVANRLSAIPQWKILLLEAGEFGDCLTNIPNMFEPGQTTSYNWAYESTPQKTSCLGMVDNRCPLPRGRGVGGSSLLNAIIYARACGSDFDQWAKHVNDSLWSYNSFLKNFIKSENFTHRDKMAPVYEPVHGKHGNLHVEYHLPRSPQLNIFLEAHKELGLPIADYNAYSGLGASPTQINTIDGTRCDGGKAFIGPVLKRKNLNISTNSYVTKILIHKADKKAYGVTFNRDNKRYIVTAKKEVILCAGAINTPQLLMLSGIGPSKHLKEVNISVIQDLEVGSKLMDHPTFYGLTFGSNYTEEPRSLRENVELFLKGVGQLAAPANAEGIGFYESSYTKGTGRPDIEILFITANSTGPLSQKVFNLKDSTYDDLWKHINVSQSFAMHIIALHTESTGTVRLKNNDPLEYPLIDTNFLSDANNKDIKTIYEGVQLALKLSKTKAFKQIDAKLQGGPLRACKQYKYLSEEYWYCAIRQVTMDIYHPVGTCPMGQHPEKGDVVNSKLKVYGVGNLRIADCSVFPFTLAGHPHAPAVAIGELLSDLVISDYL